jgi:hypothetical protein
VKGYCTSNHVPPESEDDRASGSQAGGRHDTSGADMAWKRLMGDSDVVEKGIPFILFFEFSKCSKANSLTASANWQKYLGGKSSP